MCDGMLLLFGQDLFELRFVLACVHFNGNRKARPGDLVQNHEPHYDELCVSISRSESAGQTFPIFDLILIDLKEIDLILIEKSWRYLTWNAFPKIWLIVIKNDFVEAEQSIY